MHAFTRWASETNPFFIPTTTQTNFQCFIKKKICDHHQRELHAAWSYFFIILLFHFFLFFFLLNEEKKKKPRNNLLYWKELTIKIKAQYKLNIEVLIYLKILFYIPGHKENVRSNLINLYVYFSYRNTLYLNTLKETLFFCLRFFLFLPQ